MIAAIMATGKPAKAKQTLSTIGTINMSLESWNSKNQKRNLFFATITPKNLTQSLIEVLTYFFDYKQKSSISDIELEKLKHDIAIINNNLSQPLNMSKRACDSLLNQLNTTNKDIYLIYQNLMFPKNNNICIKSPLWQKDKKRINKLFQKYNDRFVRIQLDLQKVINAHNKNKRTSVSNK